MRDDVGYSLWTYKSDNGLSTEQVFNPNAVGSIVPDFITFDDGVTVGTLDPASVQYKGVGWTPPAGMRTIEAWTPPPPDPAMPQQTAVGWPGMVQVSNG